MTNLSHIHHHGSGSLRPGAIRRLPAGLLLPDGRRVRGPAPGLACLLETPPAIRDGSETVIAAPVLPNGECATAWDLVVPGGGPLGFAARVPLPAARWIPVAVLGEHLARLQVPAAVTAWAERAHRDLAARSAAEPPPALPPGAAGLLEPGAGYLMEVEALGREWGYLERARQWFADQARAGRLAGLPLPAAEAPPDGRWVLAASDTTDEWRDDARFQTEFADRRGILAVVRRAGEWWAEIDVAQGFRIETLFLDGHSVPLSRRPPFACPLQRGGKTAEWLCLSTPKGHWTWRIL